MSTSAPTTAPTWEDFNRLLALVEQLLPNGAAGARMTVRELIDWYQTGATRQRENVKAETERLRIWRIVAAEWGERLVMSLSPRDLLDLINSQKNVKSAWSRKRWNVTIQQVFNAAATFATRATMAGVEVATVGAILGHKQLATTQRYVHVDDKVNHLLAAMERAVGDSANEARRQGSLAVTVIDSDFTPLTAESPPPQVKVKVFEVVGA